MKASALVATLVNIGIFIFCVANVSAQWSKFPIYFYKMGTDDCETDLASAMSVSLSDGGTYVSINVHPSRRGITRYKDIVRIINVDDYQQYYIGFIVNKAFDDDAVDAAGLIIRDASTENLIGTVDLKKTGTTYAPWAISPGGQLRVDLEFKISSNSSGTDTASVQLIYSPQN